jgi:hypothetical protein
MILIIKETDTTPTDEEPKVLEVRIIQPYGADRQRTVEELPEVEIEPPAPILLLIDA